MAGRNNGRLTTKEIQALLKRLQEEVPRRECWSCECLQGFIAQLEHDAVEKAGPLLAEYKRPPKEIEACLGCEPCPPADIFAEYLVRKREKNT
jgi:hypothetical protein